MYNTLAVKLRRYLKGGYPITFVSKLLILYTFLNEIRVGKNIRHKDDRMTSLYTTDRNLRSAKGGL